MPIWNNKICNYHEWSAEGVLYTAHKSYEQRHLSLKGLIDKDLWSEDQGYWLFITVKFFLMAPGKTEFAAFRFCVLKRRKINLLYV